MPVTFGTVQLVPAAPPVQRAPEAAVPGASASPPPPDPRDVARAMRHLRERAARVRAF